MRAASVLALALSLAACSDQPAANLVDAGDAGFFLSDGAVEGADGGAADAHGWVDGGPIVDQCDPVRQTGCSPPESQCLVETALPRDGTHCIQPSAGGHGLDALCTGADCGPGLVCISSSTTASCRKVCDRATGDGCQALGNDFDCVARIIDTNWATCARLSASCDALLQTPCDQAHACQPAQRVNRTFELRCLPAGPGQAGQPCPPGGCSRGTICVREGADLTCRKICDRSQDCGGATACNGRLNGLPVKYCL